MCARSRTLTDANEPRALGQALVSDSTSPYVTPSSHALADERRASGGRGLRSEYERGPVAGRRPRRVTHAEHHSDPCPFAVALRRMFAEDGKPSLPPSLPSL